MHDGLPLLTAHPTALTAEVHFRRADAYWVVLCHRAGRLLRAAETPFRVEGVVLLRQTRLSGPWQAERALVAVPSEFLADGACLYAAQSGPRNSKSGNARVGREDRRGGLVLAPELAGKS